MPEDARFELIERNGFTIAEVIADGIVVATRQDALDLVANAGWRGASHVIVHERHLTPEFFDLSTGVAGEVLQTCVNHRMGFVVIGDFGAVASASLRAFIAESDRGRQVAFVPDREAALVRIAGA